jgi:hypothetical protein
MDGQRVELNSQTAAHFQAREEVVMNFALNTFPTILFFCTFFACSVFGEDNNISSAGSAGGGDNFSQAISETASRDCKPRINGVGPSKTKSTKVSAVKRPNEDISVTQTVYCAPLSASTDGRDTTLQPNCDSGEKGKVCEKGKEPVKEKDALIPKPDSEGAAPTPGTPPVGLNSVELDLKNLNLRISSPSLWFAFLALLLAIIGFWFVAASQSSKEETSRNLGGAVALAIGIAIAFFFIGQWWMKASFEKSAKAEIEIRGIETFRAEYVTALTRNLSEDNARLRQELNKTSIALETAQTTISPRNWIMVGVALLLGIALGLLPFGFIGFRRSMFRRSFGEDERDHFAINRIEGILRDRESRLVDSIVMELDRRNRR